MYKIYVDASDRKNNIVKLFEILENNQKLIQEITGELDIAQSITELLQDNSIDLSQVEFESFPGPGSFTGLKKSFALTNVLNWALQKNDRITDVPLPNYGKEPNIG